MGIKQHFGASDAGSFMLLIIRTLFLCFQIHSANHLESMFFCIFKCFRAVRKDYYSGGYAPPDLRQGPEDPGPATGETT